MVTRISPELLRQRLQGDDSVALVDTRSSEAFESWHVPGAQSHPFSPDADLDLETFRSSVDVDPDDSIITICGQGKSSTALAEALQADGFGDVAVVQDGMEGWSRLYELAAIPTVATTLEIFQVQRVAKGCLGYVIGSPTAEEAVVVDPTRHTDEFRRVAEDDGMTITRVIDTHVHADHLSGGRALANETGATYHLPSGAADRDMAVEYTPLGRNEVLTIGNVELKAILTPGHTLESMSLLLGAEAVLTGDTLFIDSVGRTELQFGADRAEDGARHLYRSIHGSILSLPDGVRVLPGHFPAEDPRAIDTVGGPISTTVRDARVDLPILQGDEDEFVERLVGQLPEKPPNYERMLAINTGDAAPEDELEAIELELGPNRCAVAAD